MARIACDPGGTSGIAIRKDDNSILTYATKEVTQLYALLVPKYEVVICEDFIAQRIDNYMRHTIRLVGGVQALAWASGSPFTIQVPQVRRGFIKKAETFLKQSHYKYVIHEVDALAHLLAWEALNAKRPTAIAKK